MLNNKNNMGMAFALDTVIINNNFMERNGFLKI